MDRRGDDATGVATALTSLKPRQAAREVVPGGEICTPAWLRLGR